MYYYDYRDYFLTLINNQEKIINIMNFLSNFLQAFLFIFIVYFLYLVIRGMIRR